MPWTPLLSFVTKELFLLGDNTLTLEACKDIVSEGLCLSLSISVSVFLLPEPQISLNFRGAREQSETSSSKWHGLIEYAL